MHTDLNHPGLKKYREVRAQKAKVAIMRKEVRSNNADLTDNQVEEIVKAAIKAKDSNAVQTKGRAKKNRRGKSKATKG